MKIALLLKHLNGFSARPIIFRDVMKYDFKKIGDAMFLVIDCIKDRSYYYAVSDILSIVVEDSEVV